MIFFIPETPRWLVKNGKDQLALQVLSRIGGADYGQRILNEIKETVVNDIEKVHFSELLKPKMRWILFMGIILAVFQQWCGINTVLYYSEDIFAAAGYNVSAIMRNIVFTGAVMLVFTFVAIFTCDKVGRRTLMLLGSAGMALTYILLGYSYYIESKGIAVLLLVLVAIACYSFSLAPIVWVVLSEIFPNRIRGAAMSVAVFSLWVGCFTLTLTFPYLNEAMGPSGTFWLYAGICVAGFIFVKLCVPETKGKTLEEIEKELVD